MKIGILGTGRVATTLGERLISADTPSSTAPENLPAAAPLSKTQCQPRTS